MNISVVLFILANVLAIFFRLTPSISTMKSIAKDLFICPNCRHEFYPKWYHLFFKRFSLEIKNSAKLKCPGCGEVDFCKWKG